MRPEDIKELGNRYKTTDPLLIADEHFGQYAGHDKKPTYIKRAIAKIRELLRRLMKKLGFNIKYTDNDIYSLLARSREHLRKQKPKQAKDFEFAGDYVDNVRLSKEDGSGYKTELFDNEINAMRKLRKELTVKYPNLNFTFNESQTTNSAYLKVSDSDYNNLLTFRFSDHSENFKYAQLDKSDKWNLGYDIETNTAIINEAIEKKINDTKIINTAINKVSNLSSGDEINIDGNSVIVISANKDRVVTETKEPISIQLNGKDGKFKWMQDNGHFGLYMAARKAITQNKTLPEGVELQDTGERDGVKHFNFKFTYKPKSIYKSEYVAKELGYLGEENIRFSIPDKPSKYISLAEFKSRQKKLDTKNQDKGIGKPEFAGKSVDETFAKLSNQWFSNKDWEKAKSQIEGKNLDDKIRKSFNSVDTEAKSWRDVSAAIHIYLDLQGDITAPERYWDDLTKEQKRQIDVARNLTPEQLDIAKEIREFYNKLGNMALEDDVIKNVLEYYVMREWDMPQKQATEYWRNFGTKTKHAKQRTLSSIIEGWSKGYTLKIESATNNLATLTTIINNVIEDKRLLKQGLQTFTEESKPLFSNNKLEGYEEIKHPNFKNWVVIKKVTPKKEAKETIYKPDLIITKDGKTLKKEPVYAPKKVAKKLNRILMPSKIQGGLNIGGVSIVDNATQFNATLKKTVLSYSFFHHMAYTRSYLLGGAVGLKDANVFTAYKRGLESFYQKIPEVERLIRNGLTTGRIQEWDEDAIKHKTYVGKLLDKNNVAVGVRKKVLELHDMHTNFLFKKWGMGLKVQAALLEYSKELKDNPNVDPDEAAKNVAGLINADFGGLHLERMGRSKTTQHFMRLYFLAPDWTESNVLTMVNMFKKGDEGKMYRKFWLRVAMRGALATTMANLLLALWDDPDDEETYLETVSRRYKQAWDSGYLKWMDVDITPLYRGTGGESDRPKYFKLIGHFGDVIKFIVKPFVSLKHKQSILARFLTEFYTGKNWQGKSYTSVNELLGVDDKGEYLTSSEKSGYRVGDPKGGKYAGQLTKWEFGGGNNPVTPSQIPSFMLAQMRGWLPIPIQNAVGFCMGETSGFDAITHGTGFHVGSGRKLESGLEKKYDEIETFYKLAERKYNDAKKHVEIDRMMDLKDDYIVAIRFKNLKGRIKDKEEFLDEAENRQDIKSVDKYKIKIDELKQKAIDEYYSKINKR